ncbi:hypothetical protein LWC34_42700 [Kibdelosporangium philippinense]|uniref:Uncharacterized protein n=2 Tax=Kibdelosporangium philippinense TaxID=211113 RepID=A0ABS8ZUH6_9PSEU|nr:hypothetical protein [Kibdelosporangium philippinense]MCE7009477.1 hypothetical protein [Kibdelosporangium philippinense]
MRDAEKPVFASTSRTRKAIRLTSRLLAVGMVVLALVLVATTLGSVHNDSATTWLVTDHR